ncbi:MAG: helix-turn-helix transcriptional regulator [Oscillospiraceae bacterium]|jgi:predicted DNA-binding transcriptional regulator YafY
MAGNANSKLKILYIMKYLENETDENHGVTMEQILKYLRTCGIDAERKSIYSDIDLLKEFGMDIGSERQGRSTIYKLLSRKFEVPELKLLADAIGSSKFVTMKKSVQLIEKLSGEASVYDAAKIKREVFVDGRIKTMNESIYYSVDCIHNAIQTNKKLGFKYFDYSMEKQRVYRKNGNDYFVTPVALLYADDNYYLAAYTKERNKVHNYRVDRMVQVYVTDEDGDDNEVIRAFDAAEYMKEQFSMFGGIRQKVDMMFDKSLVNVVVDRFGTDVIMEKVDDERFIVHINVEVSPAFFAWVFMFGNKAKLIGPEEVVNSFDAMLSMVTGSYS